MGFEERLAEHERRLAALRRATSMQQQERLGPPFPDLGDHPPPIMRGPSAPPRTPPRSTAESGGVEWVRATEDRHTDESHRTTPVPEPPPRPRPRARQRPEAPRARRPQSPVRTVPDSAPLTLPPPRVGQVASDDAISGTERGLPAADLPFFRQRAEPQMSTMPEEQPVQPQSDPLARAARGSERGPPRDLLRPPRVTPLPLPPEDRRRILDRLAHGERREHERQLELDTRERDLDQTRETPRARAQPQRTGLSVAGGLPEPGEDHGPARSVDTWWADPRRISSTGDTGLGGDTAHMQRADAYQRAIQRRATERRQAELLEETRRRELEESLASMRAWHRGIRPPSEIPLVRGEREAFRSHAFRADASLVSLDWLLAREEDDLSSFWLARAARLQLHRTDRFFSEHGAEVFEALLGLYPIIGELMDFYTALYGRSPITGAAVEGFGRGISAAGVAVSGATAIVPVLSHARRIGRLAPLTRLLRRTDRVLGLTPGTHLQVIRDLARLGGDRVALAERALVRARAGEPLSDAELTAVEDVLRALQPMTPGYSGVPGSARSATRSARELVRLGRTGVRWRRTLGAARRFLLTTPPGRFRDSGDKILDLVDRIADARDLATQRQAAAELAVLAHLSREPGVDYVRVVPDPRSIDPRATDAVVVSRHRPPIREEVTSITSVTAHPYRGDPSGAEAYARRIAERLEDKFAQITSSMPGVRGVGGVTIVVPSDFSAGLAREALDRAIHILRDSGRMSQMGAMRPIRLAQLSHDTPQAFARFIDGTGPPPGVRVLRTVVE